MNNTWTVKMEEDGVMPLPDEALEAAGLEVGDEVEFIDNGDGSWTMQKCRPRSRIEPRGSRKKSDPVLTLSAGQLTFLYEAVRSLDAGAQVEIFVDHSSGIGATVRARVQGEIDITDLESW